MNILSRSKEMWRSMIGDMTGRYHELKHKKKHDDLNRLERSELERLDERMQEDNHE